MEAEPPTEHDGKVALMEAKLLRDELRERMEQEEDEARARLHMEKELQVHRVALNALLWWWFNLAASRTLAQRWSLELIVSPSHLERSGRTEPVRAVGSATHWTLSL
jgi:hypothetical protein